MSKSKPMMHWTKVPLGCHVDRPGSTTDFKTGDWRSKRPVVDPEQCSYCRLCWVFCPEGCMKDQGEEAAHFKPNLDYCKGCGICANECPKQAIVMVVEEV